MTEWVMQSMSGTGSAEMKQHLADKMMKQQILQLHTKNKAMAAIETAEIDIDKPNVTTEIMILPTETGMNDDDDV